MRLDVEPDFLHADTADASPTSPMQRRCIADALAMHWRCGAILRTPSRRHLALGPGPTAGRPPLLPPPLLLSLPLA
eukprot:7264738-Pyramimonas_sp.AAC.1